MRNFDLKKYLAEGHLFEEEEKLQMTYKGDPVHLQISKFGGTSEKPNETVLFIAVGGKGKRGSKGSKKGKQFVKNTKSAKYKKGTYQSKN